MSTRTHFQVELGLGLGRLKFPTKQIDKILRGINIIIQGQGPSK